MTAGPSRLRTISALGVVQILSWGSSFYLLAVLSGPIRADTGWSPGLVAGGISIALLASGVVAARVGALIQLHGGRRVLAGGMAMIALGLVMLAAARGPVAYGLAWAVIGVGMGAGLYDAAFGALGRLYGADARRAITTLTLFGGFASTVTWPLSAWLEAHFGWRATCLVYAGLHLGVTLPLCWFGLPRALTAHPVATGTPAASPRLSRDARFWLLALAGCTLAALASLWSVHFVTLLGSQGYARAVAVGIGTLFGPAQVGARLIEMATGSRYHPVYSMVIATMLIAVGFFGLLAGMPAAGAVMAFGAGNGLWSIMRGAMPLALFGPTDFARIMGLLARPALIASAIAPLAGALLMQRLGPAAVLWLLALASLVPLTVAVILWGRARRGA